VASASPNATRFLGHRQWAACSHADVRQDAACSGDVAFFDIAMGRLRFSSRQENRACAGAWRARHLVIVLLGDILGILFALINALEVDRFGFVIERDEVSAHRAGLERAFSP